MNSYYERVDKNIKRKKNSIIILIMLLLSIVSFIIMFKTDLLTVKYIEVYGNHMILKEEILNDSGIVLGNHIFKEKINKIQANLYRNPYIKTVSVKRKLPNKIAIQVVEREEEAAIPFMNEFLVIDGDGMVLESSINNEDLKIIKGLEFSNFIEGTILSVRDKGQLNKALEIVKGINLNQIAIKELDITNKKNIIIKITSDLICKVGEGNNLNYRLEIMKKILEDLEQKDIKRGVIDISHDGYPSYRPVE